MSQYYILMLNQYKQEGEKKEGDHIILFFIQNTQ